ncbi:MAG: hypothetical protein M1544_03520 [Candidatus Marsarchaeota archaeon]|nr:hypothetical protein [Candidatus Marsarchaeota archaeon]
MPVDPDDMLIFRMRHMVPNTKVVPQQISQASAAQQAPKEVQAKQQTKQAPAAAVPKPAATPQQRKTVVPPPSTRKPATNFKEQEEPMFVAPMVSGAVIEEAVETAGGDIGQTIGKKKAKSRAEQESEEAATGLSCVWHPWRPAYAICNYCHRPFCFEDIVEENGHYYCLEDIDKVGSSSAISEISGKANYVNVGVVSGILYVAVFLLFILFASGPLSSAISYSNSVGLFTFLSTAKLYQLLLILESAGTLLAFVSGFLVLLRTKAGIALGPVSAILAILMFGYGFVAYGTLYAIIIAGIAIVALITQVYSIIGSGSQEAVEEKSKNEEQATEVQFANVGRF